MTAGIKTVTRGNRRHAAGEPTIGAGFARALLELAVGKGADARELLQRSGIDPAALEDQDNRVPLAAYLRLMRAGKVLAKDPALALHFGEAYGMEELSIVGLVAGACENLAEAMTQVNRYARLVIEFDGAALRDRLVFSREGDDLWMIDTRENPNASPEITESSFARMVSCAHRFGRSDLVKAVHFTHAAPDYRAEYDRIFRVPLVFESERNALVLDSKEWAAIRPPSPPSRYLFGLLSARADALMKALETSGTARGRVESLILPMLHTGDVSMDVIAGGMGLSRQTLFRRLKDEGTTFEKLLDELRHKMALNYLSEKKVSVNETAYLTGFSESAAFSRAFKRWTGQSPRALRMRD
jgi:AraC-like DNA-binding protein